MKPYRKWIEEIAPSWLAGEVGTRLMDAVSLTIDVCTETLLEAVYARFLYSSEFPDDALPLIGHERMMPAYGPETATSYLARLKKAWTSWTFAGTPQAVLEQLTAAGFGAELKENWQWNWDDAAHPTDWWLQPGADWSRFWVIVKSHPWGAVRWGQPGLVWGGFNYGTTMSLAEERSLRDLIRQWKAGHTRCDSVIVVYDQAEWDAAIAAGEPGGTWGNPANRPLGAAYIPG